MNEVFLLLQKFVYNINIVSEHCLAGDTKPMNIVEESKNVVSQKF